MSDAYVEIGPDDADYERLAEQALTQEEFDERRRRWQEGDESLRRQFLDFLARRGHPGRGHGRRGRPRARVGERRLPARCRQPPCRGQGSPSGPVDAG